MIPNPCPFCDSKEISVKVTNISTCGWYDYFAVICDDCSARGPNSQDETKAITKWNKRVKHE